MERTLDDLALLQEHAAFVELARVGVVRVGPERGGLEAAFAFWRCGRRRGGCLGECDAADHQDP